MNVLRVVTIATQTLHAQIRKVHFSVLVVLATLEMAHTVTVSCRNVLYLYHEMIKNDLNIMTSTPKLGLNNFTEYNL